MAVSTLVFLVVAAGDAEWNQTAAQDSAKQANDHAKDPGEGT